MKIKTLFTIDGVITSFVDSTMEKIVLWDDDRTTSPIIFGENPLFFFPFELIMTWSYLGPDPDHRAALLSDKIIGQRTQKGVHSNHLKVHEGSIQSMQKKILLRIRIRSAPALKGSCHITFWCSQYKWKWLENWDENISKCKL